MKGGESEQEMGEGKVRSGSEKASGPHQRRSDKVWVLLMNRVMQGDGCSDQPIGRQSEG